VEPKVEDPFGSEESSVASTGQQFHFLTPAAKVGESPGKGRGLFAVMPTSLARGPVGCSQATALAVPDGDQCQCN
jgi:hypothetical protein